MNSAELSVYQQRMIELKADREFERQMKEADEKEKAELNTKKEEEKKRHRVQALAKSLEPLHIATNFVNDYPLYYDERKIWWIWENDKNKWTITDEVNIFNILNEACEIAGITTPSVQSSYQNALKMVARKNKPQQLGKEWIQFQNELVNFQSGETQKPSPKYFLTHPIPWRIGESEDTPTIDQLFKEWAGEGYVRTLHEILAYCLYTDYPLHVIIALVGRGRNGKSRYIELARRFVGKENTASTELELLAGRFESSKLYKKLLIIVSETDNNAIGKSQFLKKATGQDPVGFEFKGKTGFDDTMYAVWLMATNSLPPTRDDTEGFFRRWLIIDFPNQFPEGKDILEKIPLIEYENLARKTIRILKELLETGRFTNQGSIPERQRRYEERSDPLGQFINLFCDKKPDGEILSVEFTTKFHEWLKTNGLRQLTHKQLKSQLDTKGIEKKDLLRFESKGIDTKRAYLLGISWKEWVGGGLCLFSNQSPIEKQDRKLPPTHSNPLHEEQIKLIEEDLGE